jgi:hypothetical protein
MDNINFDWTLIVISSLFVLFPLLVGVVRFNVLTLSLKIIFYYIIASTLVEIVAWITIYYHQTNHWLSNISNIIEFAFLSFYFNKIFTDLKLNLYVKYFSVIILFVIILLTFIDYKNINHYNSTAYIITCFVLMTYSMIHFYELLNSLNVPKLSYYPHFWISVGILLYFSGCFFVNLFSEIVLFGNDKSTNQLWLIYHFSLIIYRIFLAIGLWFSKTPPQLSPSSK